MNRSKSIQNLIIVSWKVAYDEIKIKYRRSILGPAWISINMLITIFALGLVFSNIFNVNAKNYIAYVFCGLLSWGFISSVVLDSVTLYLSSSIKNYNFPVFFFPLKNTFKNLIISSHNLLIYIFLFLFFDKSILNWNILYLFISTPIYILNAIFISLSVGLISLRFRDVGQIIINGMYLVFLITPIFWDPNVLMGKKVAITEFNPFYYLIEIIREPMLGNIPDIKLYIISMIITIINGFFTYIIFIKNFKNKAFWV
jgi:ABC-2 type transport system permease protein/lipopolysaccharide transport system permease protein